MGCWFQTKPCDISVREFSAWRRVKGQRLFRPYLIIEIDDCPILFDGYDSVWSFIDALFPDDPLPRKAVNAAMKGDMLFEGDSFIPFTRDIQSFTHESTVEYLTLQGEYRDGVSHPLIVGGATLFDGFIVTDVMFHKEKEVLKSTPLHSLPFFAYETMLPFKDAKGTRFVPTLVFGNSPHLVFVQRIGESIATFGVHSRGPAGDVRIERWFLEKDLDSIEKKIVSLLANLTSDEREWPHFKTESDLLYSNERDEIEWLRSSHSFCA